jgi:hypothetical protein
MRRRKELFNSIGLVRMRGVGNMLGSFLSYINIDVLKIYK